jgi:GAF domain
MEAKQPPMAGTPPGSDSFVASVSAVGLQARHGSGTDGVSVSLGNSGHGLSPLWASDARAERLEERQLTLGEGPCLDAVSTGAPVLVDDLGARDHHSLAWPAFRQEVADLQVGAVFAFPVQVGVISLGCLELYRHAPGAFSESQLGATLRAVDTLTGVVLGVRAWSEVDDLVPPYRRVVHQAAGMVTVQLDVTIEEAMMRLRARAYSEGRRIDAVAADVVAGTLRLSEEER